MTDCTTDRTGLTSAAALTRSSVPTKALINPRTAVQTGIVHLGLGNFHRAHQAVYTAAALAAEPGPWGIMGVANRSRAVVDSMNAQDLLYSVVEISPAGSRVTVPGVHSGVMVADHAPETVVEAIAAPTTRIVTLTVTEHGYTTSPRTGNLDVDSPAVRHDLADPSSPMTTIGRIAGGLVARARTHGTPVAILSCDNLLANGERTEALVREFIAALGPERSGETLAWMDRHASFPNSMVDRIVPSGAHRYNEAARTSLGLIDEIAVPAEPFTMWVMQDRFPGGRPSWQVGGATFADDVEPYELMKLRLLNGTHSLIAYLGALDGRATIPEAVAQPFIESAARQTMLEDYLPTVTVPGEVSVDDYTAQLFDRWSNTALGHRTAQVGSDGSVKLAQRIPIPADIHLRAGRTPRHLALTVAAYLCCIAPPHRFDPGPQASAMADPARQRLAGLAARSTSTRDFVRGVLAPGVLFQSDLASSDDFVCATTRFVETIVAHGPHAAAAEAMS